MSIGFQEGRSVCSTASIHVTVTTTRVTTTASTTRDGTTTRAIATRTARERDRDRDRDRDPRDPFVEGLDLPRGLEREIVLDDRDRTYELNGEDSRTLATVGAFRVVSESDLRDPREGAFDPRDDDHRHLRDQGLMRSVSLDGRERVVTLTDRGRSLLECHRRDRDDERRQEFHAGVSRPRELTHDASLYRAYLRAEERLREQGADIRRVVLENDLKREYQEWLQEHNRGRPDSDGRPDRDAREIERWALEHDLPVLRRVGPFPRFPPRVRARWA